MKTATLAVPEIGLIALTRVILGMGIGLLIHNKLNADQQRVGGPDLCSGRRAHDDSARRARSWPGLAFRKTGAWAQRQAPKRGMDSADKAALRISFELTAANAIVWNDRETTSVLGLRAQ